MRTASKLHASTVGDPFAALLEFYVEPAQHADLAQRVHQALGDSAAPALEAVEASSCHPRWISSRSPVGSPWPLIVATGVADREFLGE